MRALRALLVGALAGIVAVSCVPAPPDDDVVRQFNEETEMGQIQAAGELVVGVPEDTSPLGDGFFPALARDIAGQLGVELRLEERPAEALPAMVQPGDDGEEPPADVVFPLVPLTVENVTVGSFTDPYYVAHQRLLVPEGSSITEVTDLAGEVVCEAVDATTGIRLEDIEPSITITPATAEDCLRLVEEEEVAAMTTDDLIMIPLIASSDGAVIVGEDMSTVGYGAQVETGATGFAGFIDLVFAEAEDEGRWTEFYEQWLAPYTGEEEPEIPELSVEDAAALYPPPEELPN